MDTGQLVSDLGVFVGVAVMSGVVFAGVLVLGKNLVTVADLVAFNRKQFKQILAQAASPWSQDGALLRMEVEDRNWVNPWRLWLNLKLTNRSTFDISVRHATGIISLNADKDYTHVMLVDFLPSKSEIKAQGDWRISGSFDLPLQTFHALERLRPEIKEGWQGPGQAILRLTIDVKQGRFHQNREIQLQLAAPFNYPIPPEVRIT